MSDQTYKIKVYSVNTEGPEGKRRRAGFIFSPRPAEGGPHEEFDVTAEQLKAIQGDHMLVIVGDVPDVKGSSSSGKYSTKGVTPMEDVIETINALTSLEALEAISIEGETRKGVLDAYSAAEKALKEAG